MLLFRSLKQAFEEYRKNPMGLITASVLCPVFKGVTLFGMAGVFLLFFFMFAIFNLTSTLMPLEIIGALALIAYVVIEKGIRGAVLRATNNAMARQRISVLETFNYAVGNGPRFFAYALIEAIPIAIFAGPGVALKLLVFPDAGGDILLWLSVLFGLFVTFIFKAVLAWGYVQMAVGGYGPIQAVKATFGIIKRKHIHALGLYFVYSLVWVFLTLYMLIIPLYVLKPIDSGALTLVLSAVLLLVSLFTLLVTYPIANAALIIFTKGNSTAPVPDKIQLVPDKKKKEK